MRPDKPNGEAKGTCVVAVGVAQETAGIVRQSAELEKCSFLGHVEDYEPYDGYWQLLLKIQPSDKAICVIDFDRDPGRATQAARSIRQMLRGRHTIIAVSEKSDPNVILAAMRAGCSEYLLKPLSVTDLSQAIGRAREQMQDAAEGRTTGKVLVFLGCRGGVGATTLAVHLGTSLARYSGKKTLLVDQHPDLGHVALYLGHDSIHYDFYDLVRNVSRLDQPLLAGYLIHHGSGADILPSPNVLNGHLDVSPDAVAQTIRFLADLYDIVILDCPNGVSELNLAAIGCCEELYLITTPDVAALRDLSRHIERLLQCDVPAEKVRIVVNRYTKDAAVTVEQIAKAVRQPVSITIPNNSVDIARAVNAGSPMSLERRSEFSTQMREWLLTVAPPVPQQRVEETKHKFLLWR